MTLQRKLEDALVRLGVPLKVSIVPEALYEYKCTYPMDYDYVTIHNAAFAGTVESLDYYMRTCCLDPNLQNIKSWHFSCGEGLIIQGLPLDRNGWHAGDGAGKGNRASIGIEITRDTLKPDPQGLYFKAETNALKLAAALLYIKGYGVDRIRWHQDWMPQKPCPHRIILAKRQKEVLNRIEAYRRQLRKEDRPKPPPKPEPKPADENRDPEYIYRVQVGAFSSLENAERYKDLAQKAGFDAFIVRQKK